ncbi:MAG: pantoate--beta-alanine ligase [Chthoniobacterales bacterium]|nr:pantoate--beta-alanine ligase [Chthoniobacterales bacterium]
MRVIEQAALMQQTCRQVARPLVLVTTMGALHEGHAALFRHARKVAGEEGTVAVSIFLNPKQFHLAKDLEMYPQPFEADKMICEQAGVDLIFHPSVAEMYPADASVQVEELKLSQVLCGASRPGHFTGVATVLTKIFNIIRPDIVIFGEKDWQQLAIVRRFVRDLNFPIEVMGYPTVREEDHLALSSRNTRLSKTERDAAPKIYAALQQTAERVLHEGEKNVENLLMVARKRLEGIPGAIIDYVEIMNEETLEPILEITEISKPRLFVAVKLGETRLIDNIALHEK